MSWQVANIDTDLIFILVVYWFLVEWSVVSTTTTIMSIISVVSIVSIVSIVSVLMSIISVVASACWWRTSSTRWRVAHG